MHRDLAESLIEQHALSVLAAGSKICVLHFDSVNLPSWRDFRALNCYDAAKDGLKSSHRRGVGRGLGITCGVAVGVAVGVTLDVGVGVAVGVPVGVGVGVAQEQARLGGTVEFILSSLQCRGSQGSGPSLFVLLLVV